ncbi:MAG: hypothetical protein FWE42_08295, partial [Defluviitaleaceae bacterium]|nr:hypothetical protein [Defluviitaleaceae bacterium]
TLSSTQAPFDQIVETAIDIMLPPPETYAQNPKAQDQLEKALPQNPRFTRYKEWQYTGYLAFTTIDDQPVCELRIRYDMKKYWETLLNLAEAGQIEFIKQEVYEKRHE